MAKQRRRGREKTLRPKIHISCEGANTEEDYLNILKDKFPLDTYSIRIIGQNRNKSNPSNILKYHKVNIEVSGLKKNYMPNDIEVIILDREEHNNRSIDEFEELINWRNEGKGKRLLIVNSKCFEFWLLLHFIDNPRCKSTSEIMNSLRKIWPDYDKKLKRNLSREQIIDASNRAKKLSSFEDIIESEVCGSNMYELVDLLLELEKNESKA